MITNNFPLLRKLRQRNSKSILFFSLFAEYDANLFLITLQDSLSFHYRFEVRQEAYTALLRIEINLRAPTIQSECELQMKMLRLAKGFRHI